MSGKGGEVAPDVFPPQVIEQISGSSCVESVAKPRVRRRSLWEYFGWAFCVLIVVVIARTLITNPNYQWGVVRQYFTAGSVLRGLRLTIILTFVSMVLGGLIGVIVAVCRASPVKPLSVVAGAYITFFRGTPVLVQLIFWFNISALYPHMSLGIPFTNVAFGIQVNAIVSATTAAIIGLSLNEGAYFAEIVRGGFNAVPKGQREAADALGMSGRTKLLRVTIPQSMPTIIPAAGNQLIGMFKETSLVSVLGVADLLQSVTEIYSRTYQTIPLLIVASLWYLIITLLLSYPQARIERRFARGTSALQPMAGR